ncbi:hypothetical protein ACFL54_07865 [Planctomycetota bacterium]
MKKYGLVFLGVLIFLSSGCGNREDESESCYFLDRLKLKLSSEWQLKSNSFSKAPEQEYIFTFTNKLRHEINIHNWHEGTTIDRGPMMIADETPIMVAGVKTKLVRTTMFFGNNEKVLAVHLKKGKERYLIYTANMSDNDFKQVLNRVYFVD